jgi:monothiol glutaredoxin
LRECGVTSFYSVNVLENPEVREGVKVYANWPTIPQLYVNGEFIGGSDIMMEMYQAGELQALLESVQN